MAIRLSDAINTVQAHPLEWASQPMSRVALAGMTAVLARRWLSAACETATSRSEVFVCRSSYGDGQVS